MTIRRASGFHHLQVESVSLLLSSTAISAVATLIGFAMVLAGLLEGPLRTPVSLSSQAAITALLALYTWGSAKVAARLLGRAHAARRLDRDESLRLDRGALHVDGHEAVALEKIAAVRVESLQGVSRVRVDLEGRDSVVVMDGMSAKSAARVETLLQQHVARRREGRRVTETS